MMRVRLKADGRLVEILTDGSERAMPQGFWLWSTRFIGVLPSQIVTPANLVAS